MRTPIKPQSPKKAKRRSNKRRWLHLLWLIPLLPLLASLWLAWLAPARQTAAFLSEQISEKSGFPVYLGGLRVNIWGGVDVDTVVVLYPDSLRDGSDTRPLLSAHHASFRYRLLPLLRRRFQIGRVSLVNPSVLLDMPRLSRLAPPADTAGSPATDSLAMVLPLGFALQTLEIENSRIDLVLPDTLPVQGVSVNGLSLVLDNLSLPRNPMEAPEKIKAGLQISTDNSELVILWPEASARHRLDIDWRAELNAKLRWALNARLGLDDWMLRCEADGEGPGSEIQLQRFAFTFKDRNLLKAAGAGGKERDCRLSLDGDAVSLPEIMASVRTLAGPLMPPDSLLPEFQGSVLMARGLIKGRPERFEADVVSRVEGASVGMPDTLLNVAPLHADLNCRAIVENLTVQSGLAVLNAGLDSGSFRLSDTSQVAAGPLTLQARCFIGAGGLPDSAVADLQLDRVLGGRITARARWQAGDTLSWPAMAAQIAVHADSLRLDALPAAPPDMSGMAVLESHVDLRPGGQAVLNVEAGLTGVQYAMDGENLTLPALKLSSRGHISWPDLTAPVVLDSLRGTLNDVMKWRLSGVFDVADARYRGELHSLTVDNAKAWTYLPEPVRAQLEGLSLGGHEKAGLVLSGEALPGKMPALEGGLNIAPFTLSWPENDLSIEKLAGGVDVAGSLDSLHGNINLALHQLGLTTIQPEALGDLSLSARWQFAHLDTLRIDRGELKSSMGIGGRFNLSLSGLQSASPRLAAGTEITFDAEDWKPLVPLLMARGHAALEADVEMPLMPGASVNATACLKMNDLHVAFDTLAAAGPLNGNIPVTVSFDPERLRFTDLPRQPLIEPEQFSRYLETFRSRMPGLGWLTIGEVSVMGYHLGPIEVNTHFQSGQWELPMVLIEGLSGNVQASAYMVARGGRLDSLRYGLALDAARINSGALLGSTADLKAESELNATCRFIGQGIDFKNNVDIDGYFHITRIGPQFASTLLKGMDPQGRDRNIRLTRRLLNMGWKPRLFSFEMRHGYVYPSLRLNQPWFSPIRLPEQMTLGRLPLAFFLQMSLQQNK